MSNPTSAAKLWSMALVVLIAVAGFGVAMNQKPVETPPVVVSAGLESVLGGAETAGYARVTGEREFIFPADHGPHPDFKTEWWYLTGNIESLDGSRFGYQLTVFRSATAPSEAASAKLDSEFATRQYYMAHVALTDVSGNRYFSDEKLSRGSVDIAGATATPFRAWVENWSIEGQPSEACEGCMVLRADVETDDFTFSFQLKPVKPLTLQGQRGYSKKTSDGKNASHYFSMTRLATTGFVRIADDRYEVQGTSWYDREWSTSSLGSDQAGWDWFSFQLDDGTDLMLYRMRTHAGDTDPASAGTIVPEGGESQSLGAQEFELKEVTTWTSRDTGATYPLVWQIRVPSEELQLTVKPLVDAQEHDGLFRYWEGAVQVQGERGGQPVTGVGYAELTGYGSVEQTPPKTESTQ